MAYYILEKEFELCGWKGLPFGLRYPNPSLTDFFDREEYEVIYALDGKHDINEDELSDKQKKLLTRVVDAKIALPSDGEKRLEKWQEYKSYPAMYKASVQWSVTGKCNYECRHCFMSAPDYNGEDLTLEQSEHIIDEMARCGIRAVSITGGEPMVNPNFYGILDKLKERGIILETIYSNGKLVDAYLLDELEKRNMHPSFHISFDGIGWHDWLRGVEGAEEMAVNAFKLLKKRGFSSSTSMCLHKHNIGDLKKNIDFLSELDLRHIKMNIASPTGRWKNETEHFIGMDEVNEAILEYIPQYVADGMPVSAQFCFLVDFNKESGRISIPACKYSGRENAIKTYACGVVKNHMYISPTGKVLPCMTMGGTKIDSKFESVLEKPLSDILSDSYYRDVCLVKMGECLANNEECKDCKYRLMCGAGCRAVACGEEGMDYKAIDSEACEFFKNGWYEKAKKIKEEYKDSFPKEQV